MKFVILTDPHFVPQGQSLYGLDPRACLERAVDIINRDHPDIAFVILLGDLTNKGEAAAYANLSAALAPLRAPLVPMAGNHDSRPELLAAFPQADRDPAGFVQGLHVFDSASVVTLDTLDAENDTSAGLLCPARLDFLERALAEAPVDRPLLLLQHHPPFDTGIKGMDRIGLKNPDEEWAVIARTRRPDFLFCGHLHRPISGLWRGIPFHIQRGTSHQVGFDLECPDGVAGSYEEPDYALATIGDDGIVIHQRPFMFRGPRFLLSDRAAAESATRLE